MCEEGEEEVEENTDGRSVQRRWDLGAAEQNLFDHPPNLPYNFKNNLKY